MTLLSSTDLLNYSQAANIIKEAIERCRYRSLSIINCEALSLYYGVGKFVSEHSRTASWGTKAIPSISQLLQEELPGLRGFSTSGIKRMRIFYEEWSDFLIRPTVLDELSISSIKKDVESHSNVTHYNDSSVDERFLINLINPNSLYNNLEDFTKISFSHHIEIITRTKDIDARWFYIHASANQGWSLSTLKNFCKENLYERRGMLPNNFLKTIPEPQLATRTIMAFKDEYLLDMVNVENVGEKESDWNERVIQNQIVHNIQEFILKFGKDFTFIGSNHRLVVEEEELFADLVFFNRSLNASVIVELKRGIFRHHYLGQLSGYLAAYDMLEKKAHENPSIGIILCHDANKKYAEFMIRDYDKPMGVATYRTANEMPERLRLALPDMDGLKKLLSSI